MLGSHMRGIVNERTNTVHRQRGSESDYRTACGATLHVSEDCLRPTSVDEALAESTTCKCGRCFADGGGY